MVKGKVFITDLRERTVSGIRRVQSTDRQWQTEHGQQIGPGCERSRNRVRTGARARERKRSMAKQQGLAGGSGSL